MGHLLLAAHDPGGANLLVPVMALLRDAGHRLSLAAAGPAATIWPRVGEPVSTMADDGDAGSLLDRLAPDLVVTGTSFSGLERRLWAAARSRGIGSLAAIDAWTDPRCRFAGPDGDDEQPDVLCVLDEGMRDDILAGGWCRSRLCVTGQPHLQAVTRRLREARRERKRADRPVVAFFSEPVRQDHGGIAAVGYDQDMVADAILDGLAGAPPLTLLVQPHPREDPDVWRAWQAQKEESDRLRIVISDRPTDAVLAECDAVLGMTTMVLVEAVLAGIPALAVQPGRRCALNPLLDRFSGLEVVTDPGAISARFSSMLGNLGCAVQCDPAFAAVLDNADRRVVNVICAELQKSAKQLEKKRDS